MDRALWRCGALAAALLALGIGAAGWDKAIPPERAVPTLEAEFQRLAEGAARDPSSLGPLAAQAGLPLSDGKVTVVVEADSPPALGAVGGTLLGSAPDLGLWEVRVGVDRLLDLAALPGVRYVRPPHRPAPLIQGVDLTGIAPWHAAGHRGQGVRVAVIDVEFGGLAQAVAEGRLRRVVATRDYTGAGMETGGRHGTACAEIVQDMAPEAELVLMRIDHEVHLAQAVADALALGVRVVSHSLGWFNTNFYDGTGVVCEIVRRAVEGGILWVHAAGNSADGAHWEGEWRDQDGDGLLDFAPGVNANAFQAEAGVPIGIWLTWDAWPTTDQDYDLYLVSLPGGVVVASSTGTQAGGQPPTEQVFYVPPAAGTYGVVIRAHAAPARPRLELFTTSRVKLRYAVAESSIPAPGNAPFVLTVGAIAAASWTSGPQEPYSSQGPTNRSRLNPVSITKPDLMGPDRVTTWSYGPSGFPGTSASAPHVAGVAAVLLSAHPTWTAREVREFLEQNAVDMGRPGKDNVYGHGRLYLPPLAPPSGLRHAYGAAGWYLVSVPTEGEPLDLFGVPLYEWTGTAYARPTSLSPTRGYWARLPQGKAVVAQGVVPASDQRVPLDRAGWHLVGAPWPVAKTALEVVREGQVKSWADAVAAGWVRDTLWGYRAEDGAYRRATTLEPWYGYWLYALVGGLTLRVRAGSPPPPPPEAAATALSPDELPPPPPPDEPVPGLLRVRIAPNPWRGNGSIVVQAVGTSVPAVSELRVEIFDLSGRLVWQGVALGSRLEWDGTSAGRPLANGVYLARVQARLGEAWMGLGLERIAILR